MALIKCPECGKEISDKADNCPNCGYPVDKVQNMSEGIDMNAVPITHSQVPKRKNRGCLIGLIIFFVCLFAVGAGVSDMIKNPEKYEEKSEIEKAINCTKDKANEIEKVLKGCGIDKDASIKRDEGLDNAYKKGDKGCRINEDGIEILMWLSKSDDVYIIKYNDNVLYKKGKVKAKFTDYVLTTQEIGEWKSFCETQVEAILKTPNSAKFPDYTEWAFSKNKKTLVVQGYVDAENSFGVEMRSEFQLKINTETESVKSFIFDGEELIK